MATKLTGTVLSSDLEKKIGSTIMGKYVKEMVHYFTSTIKKPFGDNIAIPTVDYFTEHYPELKKELIRLYDGTVGNVEGVQYIPESIKVYQGALLDGLCFGYDMAKGTADIYTMNTDLLTDMLVDTDSVAVQCFNKNQYGLCKALRVDVEYTYSPESFNYTLVNHRKPIDGDTDVVLVPYISIKCLMRILESTMQNGSVFRVIQDIGDVRKDRCVTLNTSVLSNYCDDPKAVLGLDSSFFPLKAFFYAPVLGAPSTTSMVTNINLFNISELRVVPKDKIKNVGVEKPLNPVYNLVAEQVISCRLMEILNEDINDIYSIVTSLPRVTSIIDNVESVEYLSVHTISKYLHSISASELEEVIQAIPGARELILARLNLLKGYKPVNADSLSYSNIVKCINNSICKITIRKKDCTLSSITCTNSPSILRKLYGENYFSIYEAFNIRLSEVGRQVSDGVDIYKSLEDNGFHVNSELREVIAEKMKDIGTDGEAIFNGLKGVLAESTGTSIRARGQSSNILVRTLSAYVSSNGIEDYYRYIDVNKIVSFGILS